MLDDLFTYRLDDDRYLTVTNASNHERDFEWFEAHAVEFEAEVHDRIDDYAMLAVQARKPAGSSGSWPTASSRPGSGRLSCPWRGRGPSSAAPGTPARMASSC